jgi:hypothetical protein
MPAINIPMFCIGACLKLFVATVHKQENEAIFLEEVL